MWENDDDTNFGIAIFREIQKYGALTGFILVW